MIGILSRSLACREPVWLQAHARLRERLWALAGEHCRFGYRVQVFEAKHWVTQVKPLAASASLPGTRWLIQATPSF
jgi:hypothetical protein